MIECIIGATVVATAEVALYERTFLHHTNAPMTPNKRKYAVSNMLMYSFEKILNSMYSPKSTPLIVGPSAHTRATYDNADLPTIGNM